LSKISSTVAVPTGLRVDEPEKITSAIDSPRRTLAEASPMTQRTASMMFDLPQPFGSDDTGQVGGGVERGRIDKGLEARQLDLAETHAGEIPGG
jgi:hypothetical protein